MPPPPKLKSVDIPSSSKKRVTFLNHLGPTTLLKAQDLHKNQKDEGRPSLDLPKGSASIISRDGSGSTGTLSSEGSGIEIINSPPRKNLRFHYHHKDGTKNDKPGESNTSTVFDCESLMNSREEDVNQYKKEQLEKIHRDKIFRAERARKEADFMNLRIYQSLLRIKARYRRMKERELENELQKVNEPITVKRSLKTPSSSASTALPLEFRSDLTLAKVVMAQRNIGGNDEISRTSACTLFVGPMLPETVPELRIFKKPNKLFLRHRHCSWKSGCMRRSEESIFQLLNAHAHKLLHVYSESPSVEKLKWPGSTEYSCFDEEENELMRIIATAQGYIFTKIIMKIYAPPGTLLGFVEEKRRYWRPRIHIKDADGKTFAFISRRSILKPGRGFVQEGKHLKRIFTVKTYGGIDWALIRGDWIDLQPKLHSTSTHFGIKFKEELNVKVKALLTVASLMVYLRHFNGKLPRREIQPMSLDEQELITGLSNAESDTTLVPEKTNLILKSSKHHKSLMVDASFCNI